MKMLGVLGLVVSLVSSFVVADDRKAVHDRIDAYAQKYWFGENIEQAVGAEKDLLEAISASNVSGKYAAHEIGIEAIIDRGTAYWLHRYRSNDQKLDVLVNAALMMLFLNTEELIEDRQHASYTLLATAAAKGYQPAKAYISASSMADNR